MDKRATRFGDVDTVKPPSGTATIHPICVWKESEWEQMTAGRTLASSQQDSSFTLICSSALKILQLALVPLGRSLLQNSQAFGPVASTCQPVIQWSLQINLIVWDTADVLFTARAELWL